MGGPNEQDVELLLRRSVTLDPQHKQTLRKRILTSSVKQENQNPEADGEDPLHLEDWPEERGRSQTVYSGSGTGDKDVQDMMDRMLRREREQGLMSRGKTRKAAQLFERMAGEIRQTHPEEAKQFDQIAAGMNLINGGSRQAMEQGLGQLVNMWQFLDGESPEAEMTNYQWMVSRMSEAADDLDAGLDELDRFTGVEEKARKLRPNPYLREITNRQEELRQALHGGGNQDGLLFHSDPRNDYDKEYAEENREEACEKGREALATILAAQSLSLDPGHAHDRRVKRKSLASITETFERSSAFKFVTNGCTPEELEELCRDPEGSMKYYATVQRSFSEIQKRSQGLARQLKATTQTSFAGRMKSWFVGSSKEYKNALESIEAVAGGTGDMQRAVASVQAYLRIRRDKVRDHQYGRDRFDGMMRFLQAAMEPTAFQRYCNEVNASRLKLNPNSRAMVHPEDYYPERSVRQLTEIQARRANKEGYTPSMRETARLMAAMELGQDDPQRPLDARVLRERTDALMETQRFKKWFETRQPGDLTRMMTQNPQEMRNYDATLTREEENRDASFRAFQHKNQELAKEESGKQPVEQNKGPKLPKT